MLWLFNSLIYMIILSGIKRSDAEVFTATGEMVKLVDTEVKVAEYLEYFLNKHIENIEKAKK